MERLMKIGFSCNTMAVRPGSRPYLHCVTMGRMFGHETVRLL